MGKQRTQVRKVRQQMRKVQPKGAPPGGGTPQQQRRQRERFVQSGGMLQGYAPEFVMRLGYISIGIVVICALVMAALILFLPYQMPVRIVAAVVWVLPIALLASFIAPGFRLALKDRKADSKLVQGQLMGASSVSTSMGLGMLMVQTRGGQEQFLCPPEKLKQVPGNQVNVVLTITPNLRHVKSVGIMGQRMVGRVEPPVPAVMTNLQRLPVITPIALALGAVLGDDIVAALPISNTVLHSVLAVVGGAAIGGAIYGVSFLLQRRLMAEVQALVPTT